MSVFSFAQSEVEVPNGGRGAVLPPDYKNKSDRPHIYADGPRNRIRRPERAPDEAFPEGVGDRSPLSKHGHDTKM